MTEQDVVYVDTLVTSFKTRLTMEIANFGRGPGMEMDILLNILEPRRESRPSTVAPSAPTSRFSWVPHYDKLIEGTISGDPSVYLFLNRADNADEFKKYEDTVHQWVLYGNFRYDRVNSQSLKSKCRAARSSTSSTRLEQAARRLNVVPIAQWIVHRPPKPVM